MSLTAANYDQDAVDAERHLKARFQALMHERSLVVLRKQELERRAAVLLSAGVTLIPSPHLKDNEFVVSQELYDAAKDLLR